MSAGVGILFEQEDGPSVVVRSVVKHGAAASSARPPLPGDTLVKVDGYDVRGLGLSQLRPWLAGDEGSVVTLSFEGSNVRYDTSVVRAVTSHGPMPSTGDGSSRIPVYGAQSSPEDDHRYRPSSHYSPGSPRDGWRSPSYRDERHDGDEYDTYAIAPQHPYSPLEGHRSDRWSAAAGSPSAAWRRAPQTSWAAEADKILAEAQAKIEDALHRERLLQETLDMLREKNAAKMRSQKDTRVRLEYQRDKLKHELEEERDRLRWETQQRDAIEMELHKSEQRLLQLSSSSSHIDRDTVDRALF